ncbi:MAG: pcaL [Desertimonas sp.]|nr:pcaL [Desertimonas sp.]
MTELNVVDIGDPHRPPIVWLGSLGSSTAMWDRQVAVFGATHRCLLIDHPGHGASPPSTGPLSIAELGVDVVAALDRREVDRAHLVGLSLGAMVAMWLAAEHSDRVDRLTLMCTTAHFEDPAPWHERAATVRAGGTRGLADTIVSRWLTPDYAAAHPDEVATFVAMINANDGESYAGCCEAIAAMDQRPKLSDIGAPTLVIGGRLDPATPPIHQQTIADGIGGSRLELVDAAHFANWELAGDVNRLLAAHLDGSNDD